MPEQNKPFVVTDRRKFTLDGTPRPDADPPSERPARDSSAPEQPPAASATAAVHSPEPNSEPPLDFSHSDPDTGYSGAAAGAAPESDMPPPPTPAEMDQAHTAYQQTADRLDTAVRAANPGVDHPPAMSFEQILTSIYMTTIHQLGGTTQDGQQPKVDLLGARQSIDMLGILADKTKGNLNAAEHQLMENALFEVRMGFLEVTQALARSAANRPTPPSGAGQPGRPSIVR